MVSQVIIFTSLLLACTVSQVYSSKACFTCIIKDGLGDRDCKRNPEHLNYVRECSSTSFEILEYFPEFAKANINLGASGETEYSCMDLQIRNTTHSIFQRGCVPSYIYCTLLENSVEILHPENGRIDGCRKCNGDLCNASNFPL